MFSYSNLPLSLLALLVTALPALSGPTTSYGPFYNIAIHAPKPPEQPICCLRPLTPLEETDQEVLLTFEEWKARRLAEVHKDPAAGSHIPSTQAHKPGVTEDVPEPLPSPSGIDNSATAPVSVVDVDLPSDKLSPHIQIPIVDRFNYASLDCSASVHNAHKSAKSASSILSSKKDRYMLSPCAENKQFVVVELCDDIRIDTVQLANYEFFSGVFKDFSVSVAKTIQGGWVPAGTYRAKNSRGVQTFHPLSLTDFYRFIRIDFHSHYGNEYYCPLSLLRVYGLTHLEHWKWDMWEDESRQRVLEGVSVETFGDIAIPRATHIEADYGSVSAPNSSSDGTAANPSVDRPEEVPVSISDTSSADVLIDTPSTSIPTRHSESSAHQPSSPSATEPSVDLAAHLVGEPPSNHDSPTPQRDSVPISSTTSALTTHTSNSSDMSHSPLVSPSSLASSQISSSSGTPSNTSHTSRNSSYSSAQSHTPQSSRSSVSSSMPVHTVHSLVPVSPNSGGESIYRTIMNRLTALEGNTTLYSRYVEEQIAGVREMMRRLGEDVGRLEGIGKAQAQMYQRSVLEFERHRKRLDLEHVELMSRVNRLTDEVILEKRLGIAQLCLLLAILIFITLTRGSRGEVVHPPQPADYPRSRTNSLREWDWRKRTLSLSGLGSDLMNRFKSSTRDPTSSSHVSDSAEDTEKPDIARIKFPSRKHGPASADFPRSKRTHPVAAARKQAANVHLRTPTSLRSPMRSAGHRYAFRPLTPTGPSSASLTTAALVSPRPPIQRTSSGGTGGIVQSASMGSVIGPVPKSAKRWARSAHLHEVKSTPAVPKLNGASVVLTLPKEPEVDVGPTAASQVVGVAESGLVGDVFTSNVRVPGPWTPGDRKQSLTMLLARAGLSPSDMSPSRLAAQSERDVASGGDAWVDTDVSSSDDESGDAHAAVVEGEEEDMGHH